MKLTEKQKKEIVEIMAKAQDGIMNLNLPVSDSNRIDSMLDDICDAVTED